MDRGPEPSRLFEAEPELDTLDDVDAHDRGRQRGIEAPVPVDVRSEPDRQPVNDDLEHAADGVSRRPGLIDPRDHRDLCVRVGAAQRRLIGLVTRAGAVRRVDRDPTDLGSERPGLDPEGAQEDAGDATGRDTGRRLARRRALEDVADVVEAVLEGAGQVGVTGSHAGDRGGAFVPICGRGLEAGRGRGVERLDGHDLRPVLPIAIPHEEQDRRAERRPVPDARHDLGSVLLDRLARAAAVPALATGEIDRQLVGGQGEPRRHALDRHAERLAVGFACCQESEAGHRRADASPDRPGQSAAVAAAATSAAAVPAGSPSADRRPPARASASLACMSSSGAGWPVHRLNAAAPW